MRLTRGAPAIPVSGRPLGVELLDIDGEIEVVAKDLLDRLRVFRLGAMHPVQHIIICPGRPGEVSTRSYVQATNSSWLLVTRSRNAAMTICCLCACGKVVAKDLLDRLRVFRLGAMHPVQHIIICPGRPGEVSTRSYVQATNSSWLLVTRSRNAAMTICLCACGNYHKSKLTCLPQRYDMPLQNIGPLVWRRLQPRE